jgi:hypothetical protein
VILLAFVGPEYRGRAMDAKEDDDLAIATGRNPADVLKPIDDDEKETTRNEEVV